MPRLPSTFAEDAAEFGRQIRALREARGWSQYELANRIDPPISRQQIHLIEHGSSGGRDESGSLLSNPRLATLVALSGVLRARIVIDVNRPSGFVIAIEAVGEQHKA